MFKPNLRPIALASLKLSIVLGMLLLPFAALTAPAQARQTSVAPDAQTSNQSDNIVVLREVKNPDGTTTVTVRIYATHNEPNAPDTNFWLSQDTYIASNNPNGNYASASNLAIGYNSGGPGAMRMLLQFNLSSIPTNATVNSATVYLYQYAASGISSMGFQAQYAVSPWSEYNATWNNSNYIGGAPLPVGYFPNTLGWLAVNSTNLFRSWVNGQEPNYGLIITGNEDPAANSSRYFYSSNSGSNRPYVDINYTTGCTLHDPAHVVRQCAASHLAECVHRELDRHGLHSARLRGERNCFVRRLVSGQQWRLHQVARWRIVHFRPIQRSEFGHRQWLGRRLPIAGRRLLRQQDAGRQCHCLDHHQRRQSNRRYATRCRHGPASTNISVSWIGNAQGGPAITSYNFDVNVNNGGWTGLLTNTPQTSYQYSGANGNNYQFRVQASNNGGASFGPWSASRQYHHRHHAAIHNDGPTAAVHHLDIFLGVVDWHRFWLRRCLVQSAVST